MTQRPFMRKIGAPFINRAGEEQTPLAFMHPCHVDGCTADAPFGVGVALLHGKPGLWACREHLDGLLSLHGHTAPVTQQEVEDDQGRDGDRDLFDARD